jgi:hypothetical protein
MNSYICISLLSLFYFINSKAFNQILDIDKMYILIGEKTFLVNLLENAITQELISILPLKTRLIGNNSLTKNLELTTTIETTSLLQEHSQIIEAKKGDLILFKGKELILFNDYSQINNHDGYYNKIGSIEQIEEINNAFADKKKILLWNSLNYENHEGKIKPYALYNSLMNYFTWKLFTFACFLII